MRKAYWYLSAYAKKHGLKLLLSIIVGIAIFSLIVPLLLNPALIKEKKYIGLVGEYTPTTLPEEIQKQVSAGLTAIKPDGSAAAGLAERWTIEQENKTYRFVLNKNIVWHDGTPITPDDIQYSFPDVQIITTPNDVIFKLPAAFSPFPTLVSKPVFKSGTIATWPFGSRPVLLGIGENMISDYVLNGNKLKQLTIENTKQVLIYRFYKTEDEAVAAFKRGEIDALPDLNRQFDIMQWPTTDVQVAPDFWNYVAVYFNMRDERFSKNVRQALSYALTKKADETRAIGPISPDSWAFLPGGKTYDKDWQRGVERLLDELPGQPLQFELTTTSVHLQLAEAIKTEWEAFGDAAVAECLKKKPAEEQAACQNADILIAIRVVSFPDLSNYQLLLVGTPIEPDPDQYTVWHSSQNTNFTGYKNTRIDNLLEKGRQSIDQAERKEIYQEFQQFLQEDPPAVFLEFLTKYSVQRINPFEIVLTKIRDTLTPNNARTTGAEDSTASTSAQPTIN